MPALPARLVIATGNPGKLREFEQLLAPLGIQAIGQRALGIPDAEETGLSFVENAILKARHASRLSGLPALADDSGLCVDALNGAPGLYSARYAGPNADSAANIRKLLDKLKAVPSELRGAHFVCALACLYHAEDPDPRVTAGRWHGSISTVARGAMGFGYDPVFLDPGSGLSASELSAEIKHSLSHRGRALQFLLKQLSEPCIGSPLR